MSKPVHGYWKLRGIAQPIRYVIAYLGLEVEEKLYEIDQSGFETWGKDKFNLGLDFPNLPYWKENGENLTESRAILKYLAREKSKDLMPTDPVLLRKADMIENILFDVWFVLIRRCLLDTEDLIKNLDTNMPKKFEQLNNFIGSNKFILGNQLSYVDFILYEVLAHYTVYESNFLKPYPGLQKMKQNFETLPAIAKYMLSSECIKSPCFHPLVVKHKI